MFENYMKQEIIQDLGVIFFYKNYRTKNFRIRIKPSKQVIVTIPRFGTMGVAKSFVEQRKGWIQRSIKKFDQKIKIPKPSTKKDLEMLREQARSVLVPCVEKYAVLCGFEYGDIRIKNMTSRWGSCSGKKNLNFSMYLALLPSEYLEYVVAHELCHTREMNHSHRFWDLLEATYPDSKKVDRAMKKYQVV